MPSAAKTLASTTSARSMNYRDVVSNFLFKDVTSDTPLVALFQKCGRAGTSRQQFDSIPDKCPLAVAVRELREETGFVPQQDFELYLRGKPFIVYDKAIGRSCTVYPFSWVLKDVSKKNDWEHTSLKWLSPQDILDGRHDGHSVPDPSKSLWRVWLRSGGLFSSPDIKDDSEIAARVLNKCLSSLKTDYDSGARYMATTALSYFYDVLFVNTTAGGDLALWRRTRMIAWHLIHNGRSSMNAAIGKSLLLCLWKLRSHRNSKMEMLEVVKTCIQERNAFSRRIGKSFATFIQRHFRERFESSDKPINISILTLSSSITKSALLTALRECNVTFDVRILESRPLCEGAQMASQLVEQAYDCDSKRLKITIATDASVAMMAKGVDLLLLGADRISEAGDVSNKTGSFPAAICARAVGHQSSTSPKVVVLSGMEKVAKPGLMDEHEQEDNGPWQISRIWEMAGCKQEAGSLMNDQRVRLKNVSFEWVPAEYIDTYINEDGEMTRQQIKEQSLFVQKLDDDVFGDL